MITAPKVSAARLRAHSALAAGPQARPKQALAAPQAVFALGAGLALLLLLPGCAAVPPAGAEGPAVAAGITGLTGKARINKAADLPRFSYPVQGQLDEIVTSPTRFAPLAAALRRDTEAVLAAYDIPDRGTQSELLGLLAALDYLDGRYRNTLARLDQVRALQDKPADKLLSGLRLRAMANAALQHAPGSPAFAGAVASNLRQALQGMPYPVIANDIKSAKAGAELMGEALVLGRTREVLQPMADAQASLSNEFAPMLVNARLALLGVLPLKATLIEVYSQYLAANQVVKPDIWAARDVVLSADAQHAPVAVAVWDSGVDTSLFAGQLVLAANGQPAVIAFDKFAQASSGALLDIPPDMRGQLAQMAARTKGFSDLQSNIDSPEASAVKQLLSGLKPEQYKAVVEELGLAGNYEHGTHVAGITLAGNPFARLVVGRIGFNHKLLPEPCPSLALAQADAANAQTVVDYFKHQGVRVVNMSWGGSVASVESELEQCGQGTTPQARKLLAREIFDIGKQGLVAAFSSAPQVLFVAAAGNSNSDASFNEDMPADIVLPNLISVGAVDRAGDEAPFTSYGPTVKVHANGYQVESFLPGGARVALSGTSMAAPQVSNLATKLLVLNPQLTPEALIAHIIHSANRTEDGRRVLMNPKAAVAAVQAAQALRKPSANSARQR